MLVPNHGPRSHDPTLDSDKLDWIEPELKVFPVNQTAFRYGTGNDGQVAYPDCT